MFNSNSIENIKEYFDSYKHEGDYQYFDHDSFQFLPDEITGLNNSYHLKKNYIVTDRDMMGYDSWFYEDAKGTEINALQLFYLSIYEKVEDYIKSNFHLDNLLSRKYYNEMKPKSISAIELFNM